MATDSIPFDKISLALKWIILSQQGVRQCKQLFEMNAFNYLVKFLLGFDPGESNNNNNNEDNAAATSSGDVENKQRMWSTTQSREFGELHAALSHLVLSCDTSSHRSEGEIM